MNNKVNLIQQKEKERKEYIEKEKGKYNLVKFMKKETKVYKKKSTIYKTIFIRSKL